MGRPGQRLDARTLVDFGDPLDLIVPSKVRQALSGTVALRTIIFEGVLNVRLLHRLR